MVLDARTREVVARITLDPLDPGGVPENVWCSAWTPDGSRLLLCAEGEEYDAEDGNLVVVDTDTWEVADERVEIAGVILGPQPRRVQRLGAQFERGVVERVDGVGIGGFRCCLTLER